MKRAAADNDTRDQRWSAIVARDPRFEGSLFYSVKSTGVYCRCGCASRTPRRENVDFYGSALEAERAGFRACKRCRPNQKTQAERYASLVTEACARIGAGGESLRLVDLAEMAGLSPFHFQRIFKHQTGITPKAYAKQRRLEQVQQRLVQGRSVTQALYDAGYGSSSRFYESVAGELGMDARDYRRGAKGLDIQFAVAECSLGRVLTAATSKGICAILMGDTPEMLINDLQVRFPGANLSQGDAAFMKTVEAVIAQVEAPGAAFALPLDVRGTVFQRKVWQALRAIPVGQTQSYAQVARSIGAPKAARAVAAACAANPVALVIPCHRVLRSDGSLSGYRWGAARKDELLKRESGS